MYEKPVQCGADREKGNPFLKQNTGGLEVYPPRRG